MPKTARFVALLVLVLSTLGLAACGGDAQDDTAASSADHEAMGHGGGEGSSGGSVDRAFAQAMIPHHESAIEMAKIAQRQGESDFVKQLADDIVAAQQEEIGTLERIDSELAEEGAEVGQLGVPEHMQGMDDDPAELRDADPFDPAFVDMMIPHHEGAIEMAKAELAKGENAELKQLAQEIIDAQQAEIREMREFLQQEDGSAGSSSSSSDDGGGHTVSSSGQNQAHATPEAEKEK